MPSHFRRFSSGRRRKDLQLRTPHWIKPSTDLEPIYQRCSTLSKALQTKFTVDHIIPINGEFITGLHVPDNLQIIPYQVNNEKSNKFTYWWQE